MSENEFRPVTRKKWVARKNITNRMFTKSCGLLQETSEIPLEVLQKRIEGICKEMKTSDYFLQALNTIEKSLKELDVKITNPQRIVCFGLGPFTRTYQALHQLAFILSVKQHFSIDEAIFFDPVFREPEKSLLRVLHCEIMTENCEAKFPVEDTATLFYLPHCSLYLTNNLLWSNWLREQLQYVILINNSFDTLKTNTQNKELLRYECFSKVVPYVKEFPIEDDYNMKSVFNDLSIHVFPFCQMPITSEFWCKHDLLPSTDPEMITVEDFSKLIIA